MNWRWGSLWAWEEPSLNWKWMKSKAVSLPKLFFWLIIIKYIKSLLTQWQALCRLTLLEILRPRWVSYRSRILTRSTSSHWTPPPKHLVLLRANQTPSLRKHSPRRFAWLPCTVTKKLFWLRADHLLPPATELVTGSPPKTQLLLQKEPVKAWLTWTRLSSAAEFQDNTPLFLLPVTKQTTSSRSFIKSL